VAALVVITGPIGSGKSTIAGVLASRLGARTTDLDDLFFADVDAGWRTARVQQAAMVRAWLDAGDDVVVHGPFGTAPERADLDAIGIPYLLVLLSVPFDVAEARVLADSTRGASRDRDFLRRTHDEWARIWPTVPADVVYDTASATLDDVVDDLVTRLRACRGTAPDPRS